MLGCMSPGISFSCKYFVILQEGLDFSFHVKMANLISFSLGTYEETFQPL
jgi:hypothetical protein